MVASNNTLVFLLPLISDSRYDRRFFITNNFMGAFIGDIDRHSYEYEVLLVYKTERRINYHKFSSTLRKNPYFSKVSYLYPEKDVVVFVFKVPIEYEQDYKHIMNGDYHKASPDGKLRIVKFWEPFNEKDKISVYLFKPEEMESNKWTIPDYEDEFFDIEEIK